MSKRNMNKVFSCAGDCGVKIHYQDTDPIHLNYEDVHKVVKRYNAQFPAISGYILFIRIHIHIHTHMCIYIYIYTYM